MIKYRDLVNIADEKVYLVDADFFKVENNLYLKAIKDICGEIAFFYDNNDKLQMDYALRGTLICPDAITLEDVEVKVEVNECENVVYKEDEDGFYLIDGISPEELAKTILVCEAPISVVKNEKIEYSRGDGWSFVSEEEYTSSSKEKIDPRLEKLKEYKFEEE